jgi:1-acyl-sn-glycerol-3-phosphate acyltransferase
MHGRLDAHRGNVLVVANHVSWLDIFVLNAEQPARFVAKAELAAWPLIGRLIRNVGTIFVTRARRRDTRRVNHDAARALEQGDVVAVFPEGTTGDGTTVLRFHASLLQPVVDSHGHVQPVALRYLDATGARSSVAFYGDETFAQSFWRLCGERKLVVEIRAIEPIAARHAHRRDLARDAEAAIRRALGFAGDSEPRTACDRATASP